MARWQTRTSARAVAIVGAPRSGCERAAGGLWCFGDHRPAGFVLEDEVEDAVVFGADERHRRDDPEDRSLERQPCPRQGCGAGQPVRNSIVVSSARSSLGWSPSVFTSQRSTPQSSRAGTAGAADLAGARDAMAAIAPAKRRRGEGHR
jgi:hypothetical protein